MLNSFWEWLALWFGFDVANGVTIPDDPNAGDFGGGQSPPGPPPR